MWSNLPDGGAVTNLKKLLRIIFDNLLIFIVNINLTTLLSNQFKKLLDSNSLFHAKTTFAVDESGFASLALLIHCSNCILDSSSISISQYAQ